MEKTLRVGQRVILTSKAYNDNSSNPLWKGKYGKIIGTIIKTDNENYSCSVKWDNGSQNSYVTRFLTIYNSTITQTYKIINLGKEFNIKQ